MQPFSTRAQGSLKRLVDDRSSAQTSALKELTRVSGIGPAKAAELYEKHKIIDLPMLALQAEQQPGLLSAEQRLGLRFVRDFETRIPRAEMARRAVAAISTSLVLHFAV